MSVDPRTWPRFPAGTRVTGRTPGGHAVKFRCRDHVFELITEAERDDLPGGPERWTQMARCLVCGDVTQPIDTLCWVEAGPAEVMKCISWIEEEVRRLEGAKDALTGERVWHDCG